MADILLIYGTRPEAIKLGVLAHELREVGASVQTLCTGQHTSLLAGTPAETDLAGGVSLNLASDGNVARWVTRAQEALLGELRRMPDDTIVVVQGDTMTVQTGAETATLAGLRVAHVEAGVRSHNLNNPWPEEAARVAVAQLATWHFAPTSTAFANLLAEGVPGRSIYVTGNTCVSALARYAPQVRPVVTPSNTVLVTLHRSEVKEPKVANALYGAVRLMALRHSRTRFLWPMHPAMERVVQRLGEPENLHLIGALPYREFVAAAAASRGILTDSGGLTEEAVTLGVPTAIMRDVNDRPEAEDVGLAQRYPPTASGVFAAVGWLLGDDVPARAPNGVFAGDGDPAGDIAKQLLRLAR